MPVPYRFYFFSQLFLIYADTYKGDYTKSEVNYMNGINSSIENITTQVSTYSLKQSIDINATKLDKLMESVKTSIASPPGIGKNINFLA